MREVMGELGLSIIYLTTAGGYIGLIAWFIAQIV
jgi:hypothetical protein